MIRGVGLRGAVAVNVAAMIGAGPLITIPLVVVAMHGSVSIAAWIVGAIIALCDGLVYAELASRLPRTGGTYAYLREAFGPHGPGRLIAFLYVWQLCFSIPLLLASGYIGFSQYAGFLVPAVATNVLAQKWLAVGVGVVTLVALCRAIPTIARTAIVLSAIALLTLATVAFAGLFHPAHALGPVIAHALDPVGIGALGAALVITAYDYAGYGDVTQMGEEVIAPQRTLPLAVLWSVAFVAVAYILLNFGVFATLTPDVVAHATSVASDVVDRTLGHPVAIVVTFGVLITAFASTYGALLGAARVPFAAARDGDFLAPFARLHPTAKYPVVSLVVLGLLALPACFLSLGDVINALTAAQVLIGSVGQIIGLALLRRRAPDASFRMPLYPLPALIALAAWVYLFIATGTIAMLFGVVTLAAGAIVFLIRARTVRAWPFATAVLAAFFALASDQPANAQPAFGNAALVQRDGGSELIVNGKPFFIWGASFFYYRLPADRWAEVLDQLKAMHFNTLDLYVPWNWHEPSEGHFDFTGSSDARRNLENVLALARDRGFYFVVRPGPVIRNEWRNGGYPDWLLKRPEYGMPLHDILEGRYPATATLQNANSDDAAAQWMANATHITFAHRWLTTALREFAPVADRVIAVQLDDDQGAYLDNQTWPAPHLQQYLGWLESTAREVIGPTVPVYINTYEMKVTASSPVWAMGNWYQSDAYSIGEHDRSTLEFSTGLLQTQLHGPVAISEFQAGWLAQPEDPQPRPADPTNTTLALHTLLGMGARGVIDFPPIDTFNPDGWEAPFANASYAWGSALGWAPDVVSLATWPYTVHLHASDRYTPTRSFGAAIERYGSDLATAHRIADGAIAYLTSAYEPGALTQADVFTIAARTQDAQRDCRARALTCDVVDLAFADDATLERYPFIIIPASGIPHPFTARTQQRVTRFQKLGGRILGFAPLGMHPVNGGIPNATVLASASGKTFLDIVNYDEHPISVAAMRLRMPGGGDVIVDPLVVQPRAGILTQLHAPNQATIPSPSDTIVPPFPPYRIMDASLADMTNIRTSVRKTPTASGDDALTLSNGLIAATFRPKAGGRLTFLGSFGTGLRVLGRSFDSSMVTTVGALRDDVSTQPPLSQTDRIGKYTRSFPAGMFNRSYVAGVHENAATGGAQIDLTYDAPDVVPGGARFLRHISLERASPRLLVQETANFPGDDHGSQRLVRYDSFDTTDAEPIDARPLGAFGLFYPKKSQVLIVSWPLADIESADTIPERTSIVLKLRFAPADVQARTTVYTILAAMSMDAATAAVTAEAKRTQAAVKERAGDGANMRDGHGEVVKW